MPGEYQEVSAPAFRRIELSQLNMLEDLKPQALAFKEKLGEAFDCIQETRIEVAKPTNSFERLAQGLAIEEVLDRARIQAELARLGRESWQEQKREGVVSKGDQEALAGVYLVILGSAQELSPDDVSRIIHGRELTTTQASDFLFLTQLYDEAIERSLRPSVLGRITGKKGNTFENVQLMEEKIWQAFQKKEESIPRASSI